MEQQAGVPLVEVARQVAAHDRAVRDGEWARCEDFCFAVAPIVELTGGTLGLVGMGRIGRAFAKIGAAMGMRLIGHDVFWPDAGALAGLEVEQVDIDALFARSDVVSLHCPLTDDNYHMVNAARLARMKRSAMLINTSRGPLVDQTALAEALTAGQIAGAALDVLETEPPAADEPLLSAPNCLITPHVAWFARESRQRLMQTAADNLEAFRAGRPQNVVGV